MLERMLRELSDEPLPTKRMQLAVDYPFSPIPLALSKDDGATLWIVNQVYLEKVVKLRALLQDIVDETAHLAAYPPDIERRIIEALENEA